MLFHYSLGAPYSVQSITNLGIIVHPKWLSEIVRYLDHHGLRIGITEPNLNLQLYFNDSTAPETKLMFVTFQNIIDPPSRPN